MTLNTIVYESNFREILNKDSWFFNNNLKSITHRLLTCNNITNLNEFNDLVDKMKLLYKFDLVHVSDFKDKANEFFKLNIDENTKGYLYTMPYFVSILNVKTSHILNIASDCMDDIKVDDTFISEAISELETNPKCASVMVAWTKDNYVMKNGLKVAEYEQSEYQIPDDNPKFNYSKGFTDQFFLNSIYNLKKINYNVDSNYASGIYNGPTYGGNSFEKRMVAHQAYNKTYNCTSKGDCYYIHDNNYY